jgi:hypothetical protein
MAVAPLRTPLTTPFSAPSAWTPKYTGHTSELVAPATAELVPSSRP